MTTHANQRINRVRHSAEKGRKNIGVRNVPTRPRTKPSKDVIIVPFDFTPASEHALDHAITQARNFRSGIRIVHVLQQPYGYGFLETHERDEWRALAKQSADERLATILASRRCDDIPIVIEVRSGLPEFEILKAAEAANTSLIVIGRKMRGALSRWIFGSVTENVLDGSRHPVLILTSGTK